MSNAIARRTDTSPDANRTRYEPQTLDAGLALAERIATTGLVPNELRGKPNDVFLIMAQGAELGIPTMQALRGIYVVKGRVTLSADLMVALCLLSPNCERFHCVEQTESSATWETLRKGSRPQRITFSLDDARRAGLTNSQTWKAYPGRMCSARAKAFLARDVYPDILGGFYTKDEVLDGEADLDAPGYIDAEVVIEPVPVPEPVTPVPVPEAVAGAGLTEGEEAWRMGLAAIVADGLAVDIASAQISAVDVMREWYKGRTLAKLSRSEVLKAISATRDRAVSAKAEAAYQDQRERAIQFLIDEYPELYADANSDPQIAEHAVLSIDSRVGNDKTVKGVGIALDEACAAMDAELKERARVRAERMAAEAAVPDDSGAEA